MRVDYIDLPDVEPVLLEEAKNHLRLDGVDEDTSLDALIVAARDAVESHLRFCLVSRTVHVFMDCWPGLGAAAPWWDGVREGAMADMAKALHFVRLPVRPVQSVQSVHTIADDGTETLWDGANYYLKPGLSPGLYRKQGISWPQPGRVADGIRITATVGFGASWNDVPAAIRQAVLLVVAHLYMNRGDAASRAVSDSGAAAMLAPYRDIRL